MENKVVDRFLRYVKIDTESDYKSGLTPSTLGQYKFAEQLVDELKSIGITDAILDDNGYVMGTIPSNIETKVPTVGFIAHMDTSPDFSGRNVNPQIIDNYNGEDIVLNQELDIVLSTSKFPEIKNYVGKTIITTDGTTLLGADDKAGIAEILTAAEFIINNPEIKHGDIRLGFTPDEEIGQGADEFDVKKFNADWAYTLDGGEIGELEDENFNAASAVIKITGISVHPGYAKNKMRNSMRIANQFMTMVPRCETPEHTTEREGFYHLMKIDGSIELTTLQYIIRDHDKDKFENRKAELTHLVSKIESEFGEGVISIEITDSYFNMKEMIDPVPHVISVAEEAMHTVGITPIKKAIRGGTDGARLSFMGLPCPNIFAGGHNFHGKYEYIPTSSMVKACEVILEIVKNVSKL